MNNAKFNFLSSGILKRCSIAEVVRKYKLYKGYPYSKITKINAHNESVISSKDVKLVYKIVYDYWYDYILQLNLNTLIEGAKLKVQSFLKMNKYKKQHMSPDDCYRFVHYDFDKLFENCGALRPMNTQSEDEPLDSKGRVYPDFLHCYPLGTYDISCRLYLNIKPKNIAKLCEKLLKKCYANRLRVYFKFWTNDERNDTFLIYANYNNIQQFIEILREIRKEDPKIFEGCEKLNPLLANIDNFIGFGEEPEYKRSSFNSERADAIQAFTNNVVEKEIKEERKRIGNYDGTINTSRGDVLKIYDYLVYRLEQSFKETLNRNHYNILNKKFPASYANQGDKAISAYIEVENNIYNACIKETPIFVKQQIQAQATRYLQGLREGKNLTIAPIVFKTRNLNVFPYQAEKNLKDRLNKNGYLEYNFKIELDMQEKLFDVFGSEKRIESVITDNAMEPYLEEQHVSAVYPCLNIETEKMLKQQNYCF